MDIGYRCPWCGKPIVDGQTLCDSVPCRGPIRWGPDGPATVPRPITAWEEVGVIFGGLNGGVLLWFLVGGGLLNAYDRWGDGAMAGGCLLFAVLGVWFCAVWLSGARRTRHGASPNGGCDGRRMQSSRLEA